jgi:predicted MFS family arabinose efflux permease
VDRHVHHTGAAQDQSRRLTVDDSQERVLTKHMSYTLAAVFLMFVSIMMVIVVSPVVIEDASGRTSDAGFVTAAFSVATVITDLFMPRLLRTRIGTWLLAVGLVVIALSAPLFALGSDNVTLMLAAAAVRGIGFGFGSVTASLFVVNLAPAGRRGRALAFYGLSATVPAVVGPSIGLVLLEAMGVDATFGISAAIATIGVVAAGIGRHERAVGAMSSTSIGRVLRSTIRLRAVRRPFIVSLVTMVTFGGILSFAPLGLPHSGAGSAAVFFLIAGAARAGSRWVSGGMIDKRGPTGPLLIGVVVVAVGCAFLVGPRDVVPAMVAAVLGGIGLGVVMNAGYVAMIDAAEDGTLGVVSSLWNLSIDGGIGVGALVLGLVADVSIDAVFVALPIAAALAVPSALAAYRAGRVRNTELTGNNYPP